jgi:hypothetical protein
VRLYVQAAADAIIEASECDASGARQFIEEDEGVAAARGSGEYRRPGK